MKREGVKSYEVGYRHGLVPAYFLHHAANRPMKPHRITRQQIAAIQLTRRLYNVSDKRMKALFVLVDGAESARHLTHAGVRLVMVALAKFGPPSTLLYPAGIGGKE